MFMFGVPIIKILLSTSTSILEAFQILLRLKTYSVGKIGISKKKKIESEKSSVEDIVLGADWLGKITGKVLFALLVL